MKYKISKKRTFFLFQWVLWSNLFRWFITTESDWTYTNGCAGWVMKASTASRGGRKWRVCRPVACVGRLVIVLLMFSQLKVQQARRGNLWKTYRQWQVLDNWPSASRSFLWVFAQTTRVEDLLFVYFFYYFSSHFPLSIPSFHDTAVSTQGFKQSILVSRVEQVFQRKSPIFWLQNSLMLWRVWMMLAMFQRRPVSRDSGILYRNLPCSLIEKFFMI